MEVLTGKCLDEWFYQRIGRLRVSLRCEGEYYFVGSKASQFGSCSYVRLLLLLSGLVWLPSGLCRLVPVAIPVTCARVP